MLDWVPTSVPDDEEVAILHHGSGGGGGGVAAPLSRRGRRGQNEEEAQGGGGGGILRHLGGVVIVGEDLGISFSSPVFPEKGGNKNETIETDSYFYASSKNGVTFVGKFPLDIAFSIRLYSNYHKR